MSTSGPRLYANCPISRTRARACANRGATATVEDALCGVEAVHAQQEALHKLAPAADLLQCGQTQAKQSGVNTTCITRTIIITVNYEH